MSGIGEELQEGSDYPSRNHNDATPNELFVSKAGDFVPPCAEMDQGEGAGKHQHPSNS